MVGTRISTRRGRAERRRMVAPGFFEIDGCVDVAGGEWTIPGKFLYYATAMPRRTGAIPLIATTVDGRPIKLEGNPLNQASGGATDTFVQASILDLYDPSRSRRFVPNGKASNRAEF